MVEQIRASWNTLVPYMIDMAIVVQQPERTGESQESRAKESLSVVITR